MEKFTPPPREELAKMAADAAKEIDELAYKMAAAADVDTAHQRAVSMTFTASGVFTTPLDTYYGEETWVREQLARFTYKPGWSFDVQRALGGFLYLKLMMKVEDTYHPGQTIEVGGYRALDIGGMLSQRDPELFARLLAGYIQELEIHESREWLKRDGEIYDNPHL